MPALPVAPPAPELPGVPAAAPEEAPPFPAPASTGPLPPDIYAYTFNVDGTTLADPGSALVKPIVTGGNQSLVHVRGPADLSWEVKKGVPRGTLHRHFYESAIAGEEREFYVYTPPGYEPDGRREYPVGRRRCVVSNCRDLRELSPGSRENEDCMQESPKCEFCGCGPIVCCNARTRLMVCAACASLLVEVARRCGPPPLLGGNTQARTKPPS